MLMAMTTPLNPPAWVPCDCCENYLCNIHGSHAHDCECPAIDDWPADVDPYTTPIKESTT